MASLFGHALLGCTLSKVLDKTNSKKLFVLAIISAILPDVDVLSFEFGIPYEHWLGHRGFTHSIVFAIIWSLVMSVVFGKNNKWLFFIILFLATLSHAVLDAMTTGGLGVGFFIPFENTRYFLGFRPIQVSPIGIEKFFSEWGFKVIMSELIWIGLPCGVILIINKIKNRWTLKTHS